MGRKIDVATEWRLLTRVSVAACFAILDSFSHISRSIFLPGHRTLSDVHRWQCSVRQWIASEKEGSITREDRDDDDDDFRDEMAIW